MRGRDKKCVIEIARQSGKDTKRSGKLQRDQNFVEE